MKLKLQDWADYSEDIKRSPCLGVDSKRQKKIMVIKIFTGAAFVSKSLTEKKSFVILIRNPFYTIGITGHSLKPERNTKSPFLFTEEGRSIGASN